MKKRFYQAVILLTVLLVSLAGTGQALAWSSCGTSYYVQWGETLSGIAANCGTSASALRLANPGLGYWAYAGQVLNLPGATWDNGNGSSTYIVAPGDTLKVIAVRYGISMGMLASMNDIYNYNLIYVGQILNVPGSGYSPAPAPYIPPPPPAPVYTGSGYTIRSGDTLRIIAYRYNTTVTDILSVNPQITTPSLIYVGQWIALPVAISPAAAYHTVQVGDTLRIIAYRYSTTVANLQALNPQIWNSNLIYAGMSLRVR